MEKKDYTLTIKNENKLGVSKGESPFGRCQERLGVWDKLRDSQQFATHRKSSVFLPPNSLPALSKLTPPKVLGKTIINSFQHFLKC